MAQIILGIFIIGNLILSLAILLNNPRSWTNRLFFFLILTITTYLTANTELYAVHSHSLQILFTRSIAVIGSLLNFVVFLFLYTFPKDKILLKKPLLYAGIAVTTILMTGGVLGMIFNDVTFKGNSVTPTPGFLLPLFLIDTLFFIVGGIVFMIRQYRRSTGIDKNRILFVVVSFVFLFSCIIVFNFILPAFFKIGILVPLLPLYILVFNAIVAYAIIRQRLLDIRLLVARSIAYAFVVVILGAIFSAGVFIVSIILLGKQIELPTFFIFVVFALMISFSRGYFTRLFEKYTDKIFYKDDYSQTELLSKLSHILASSIELSEITKLLLEELLTKMKISEGAVILVKNGAITWNSHRGKIVIEFKDMQQKECTDLITWIIKSPGENVAVFEELEESPQKNFMRDMKMSVVLPLVVESEIIGALIFASKSSGEIYSSKDINVFKILAPEAAVAIKNAQAYDEIRRFNITLKEEVQLATKDLKEANIHLQDANDKLKELDHLKDEFVSLASHELRTPMTIIKSYVWMLINSKTEKVSEHQKHYLDTTYASIERLIHLVNDMLNISRIESGKVVINKSPIDIGDLIATQVSQMQSRGNELGVKIDYQKLDQPLTVLADPDKISQVLINLVGNSFKFTPRNGSIKVTVTKTNDSYAEISITDTGRGMSATDLSKLFQRFSMVGDTHLTKEKGQGTGLGLYLSKSLVELHGGKIWAQSAGVDQGSTFSFTLPMVTSQKQEHTNLPQQPNPQA